MSAWLLQSSFAVIVESNITAVILGASGNMSDEWRLWCGLVVSANVGVLSSADSLSSHLKTSFSLNISLWSTKASAGANKNVTKGL